MKKGLEKPESKVIERGYQKELKRDNCCDVIEFIARQGEKGT